MPDPTLVAVGTGLLGFALGVYADYKARNDEDVEKPDPYYSEPGRQLPAADRPVCGCGHHLSYHDPNTGQCLHKRTFLQRHVYTAQCSCQQYIGPEPVPHYLPQ